MSEQDVKAIEAALKKVNNVYKIMITVMITNILVIIGVVWWASAIDYRVGQNEKDQERINTAMEKRVELIDETSWKYNDYFTRYLWAERWQQTLPEPPYNTRGPGPKI